MGEGGVVKDEEVGQAREYEVDEQAENPDGNWGLSTTIAREGQDESECLPRNEV